MDSPLAKEHHHSGDQDPREGEVGRAGPLPRGRCRQRYLLQRLSKALPSKIFRTKFRHFLTLKNFIFSSEETNFEDSFEYVEKV